MESAAGGRWVKGQSGNPAGRRKGSRNRATLLAEALLAGEAEELARGVLDEAKAGDKVARRFCLGRLLPPARERRVLLPDLPAPSGWPARDAREAFRAIRAALLAGAVTPGEALALQSFFLRGQLIED